MGQNGKNEAIWAVGFSVAFFLVFGERGMSVINPKNQLRCALAVYNRYSFFLVRFAHLYYA